MNKQLFNLFFGLSFIFGCTSFISVVCMERGETKENISNKTIKQKIKTIDKQITNLQDDRTEEIRRLFAPYMPANIFQLSMQDVYQIDEKIMIEKQTIIKKYATQITPLQKKKELLMQILESK